MEFELLASSILLPGGKNYIQPIVSHMTADQFDHKYFDFTETYLKYRPAVAEWMIDVCDYFNLHVTTSHAAIYYLDRLQINEKYSRKEWQLLAVCCILIAAKYNECEEDIPSKCKLEGIAQHEIPNETILQFELWILKNLGWKLNARSPSAFLTAYQELGIFSLQELVSLSFSAQEVEKIVGEHFKLFSQLIILNISYKSFKASDIACALVCFTRSLFKIHTWSSRLTALTLNRPDRPEVRRILNMIMRDPSFNQWTCNMKFRTISIQDDGEMAFSSPVSSRRPSHIMTTPSPDKENRPDGKSSGISPTSVCDTYFERLAL